MTNNLDPKEITQKIPKVIHYCWFGGGVKSDLILSCIDSWKREMPDYEIKEWTEKNFDHTKYPYTLNAYSQKKWAFVSDYARLKILEKEGGIYLDTDMYMLKSMDDLLDCEILLGKEDSIHISAGMIGVTPKSIYIKKCLDFYNENTSIVKTIPKTLTDIYNQNKEELSDIKIKVLEPQFFYPFTADNIKEFNYYNAPSESYGVHMWNYSWGHPLIRLSKNLGLHRLGVKILDKLKIKKILKKILKIV